MTTTQDKLGSYSSNQRSGASDREIEARALLSCASRLRTVIDTNDKDMNAYAEAIRHNQHLWTLFQVALCDPDNPLPKDLKVTLLNLSRYIDKVSFRAISEFAPSLVTSLIDINRMIATGLSRRPKVENQAPTAEALTPPSAVSSVMTTA